MKIETLTAMKEKTIDLEEKTNLSPPEGVQVR
jgi:hypothetical protein